MLEKLSFEKAKKNIDFAYALALDVNTSSYPSFRDGLKNKDDFIRAVSRIEQNKNEEVLLYCNQNLPTGWIQWYYIEDANLIKIFAFLAKSNYQEMLKEFLDYINTLFCNVRIAVGLPRENEQACMAIELAGFNLVESSYVTILKKENFKPVLADANIIRIELSNFKLFEDIHKNVDMYWNVQRIKDDFENWDIFYYEDGVKKGAIYTKKMGKINEIFGIDYSSGSYDERIGFLLVNHSIVMNSNSKMKFLYYFTQDKSEVTSLKRIGFEYIDEYCYYEKN